MNVRTSYRGGKGIHQRLADRKIHGVSIFFKTNFLLLKRSFFIFLILAVGYGSWHWMCHSRYFCLNKILVEGGPHMSHEDLLRLTGLTSRTNILAVNLDSIKSAIERYPWVKKAEVRRRLPDRLIIMIKERVPVAAMESGGKMYLVDGTGAVFKEAAPAEVGSLPVITGADHMDAKRGILSGFAMKALELITMAGQGTRTLGAGNIKKIIITNNGDLMLYTVDHDTLIHFKAHNIKTQFARAEKILFQLYRSGKYERVASIDLDYGQDMAVARLKD
ncbi:MAG: cell division protein FtsQ/DivIB [Dissulfurimicrobium sp.]|uniref:cell division protein FtsQ/DivIB n=1 Tax=Dissulfurimicrobium TaxID=1769732 RepID=UPI003C734BBB